MQVLAMIADAAVATVISPTPKASNMLGQGNALDSGTTKNWFSPARATMTPEP
jgi:hypothetical protein